MTKETTDLTKTVSLLSKNTLEIETLQKLLSKELLKLKSSTQFSLKENEEIFSLIPDGIIFFNKNGFISKYNYAAKKILNTKSLNLKGKHFSEIFPDQIFGFSFKEVFNSPPLAKTIALSLNNKKSSKEIEVFVRTSKHKNLLILLRDRSSCKQLENSLLVHSHLLELGQMAATLAHEIRNPLGGIIGFASLLKEELSNNNKLVSMTEAIINGSQSLNNLVSKILSYSKPEVLNMKPLDISQLINESLPLILAALNNPPCLISLKRAHFRLVDSDRFKTVIWNLVKNAVEASPPGAHIQIKITKQGTIKIIDKGLGISEENMKKLFSPFFTTKFSGTGLGLAEANKVIQAHGGRLSVKTSPKTGTEFSISLPKGNASCL